MENLRIISVSLFLVYLFGIPPVFGALPPSDSIKNVENVWIEKSPTDGKVWKAREICIAESSRKNIYIEGSLGLSGSQEVIYDDYGHYILIFDDLPSKITGKTVTIKGDFDPYEEPLPPVDVSIRSISSSKIKLDWNENREPDFDCYWIFRGKMSWFFSGGLPEEPTDSEYYLDSTTSSQYLDKGLEENTTYYYRVVTLDNSGYRSNPSSIVSSKTNAISRSSEKYEKLPWFIIGLVVFSSFIAGLVLWKKH